MAHLANLPTFINLTVDTIKNLTTQACALMKQSGDRLCSLDTNQLTYDNVFQYDLFEDSKHVLQDAIFNMEVLHPEQSIRDQCVEASKIMSDCSIEQGMRKDVYNVVSSYYNNFYQTEKSSLLTSEQVKFVEKTMFGYEKLGLNLPDDKYEQVKEINKQISIYGTDYESNISNVKTEFYLSLSELDGLDEEWLANRFVPESNSYKVKLQYPDYVPIMEYCKVRSTRKMMAEAMGSRCIDVNLDILMKAVDLRKKRAELFGYKSHSDFKLKQSMANDCSTVMSFLHNLLDQIKPLAKSDIELLTNLAREMDGLESLESYDVTYYSRIYTEKESNLQMKDLQKMFTIKSVTDGIFNIYQQLLGLKFVDITEGHESAIYHSDVKLFCVYDSSDQELSKPMGYFYLDLFPREGKYSHAAMFTFVSKSEYNLPVSAIVCNFDPALNVEFDNVVTYFHEFGHLMHNMCSTNKIASLSGTHTQRDFVETPSQMFEEWCYCEEPLKMLVTPDYVDSINSELLGKINKQKKLMQGIHNARQLSYGLLDMAIHSDNIPTDTWAFYNNLSKELFGYGINPKVNMLANWGHMFGYDSSYYGYLWSQVYSIDLFSFFSDGNRQLDPVLGRRLRDKILAIGGAKDGLELLRDFMEREPNANAFIEWLKA